MCASAEKKLSVGPIPNCNSVKLWAQCRPVCCAAVAVPSAAAGLPSSVKKSGRRSGPCACQKIMLYGPPSSESTRQILRAAPTPPDPYQEASIIRIHPRSRDGFTAEPHTVQCTPRGSRHPSPTTVSSRLPPLPSCGSHQSSCGSYAAATTYGRCMHACVVSATVSSYTMWQPPRMADGTQPLVVTPINPIQVAATSHGRKDTGATRKPHVHALVINPNRERASCAESAVAAALLHQIECARCNGMLIIRVEHNENISKRGSPYITRCRNWTYAPLYEQCPACLCRGP